MNTDSVLAYQTPSAPDPISGVCQEFDRRWAAGENPRIEEFLDVVHGEERRAAFERLLAIDLAYQALSGDTVAERDYRARFPDYLPLLERAFRQHESLIAEESHLRSQSSTLLWDQVARAIDPAAAYLPEQMIDRYRLMNRVGRGGFGEVWRAVDTELGREVAIKLARSDRQIPDGLLDQLRTEARHAASMKHPGIVPVYDIGRTPRGTYLVSEFIEGETLAAPLRRGAIPQAQAVQLTIQIAEALHHAHLRGLVHRDVKPGNILLRASSLEAVLTDFGLAVTEVDQLREMQTTVGTWLYMSPEQARGESRRVDARSDIYSLGVVFYQMLTGRLPFVAATREDYLDQLKHRPPRPPRTIDDALDPELERICLRCLSKEVDDRFTTAADFAGALSNWRGATASVSPQPAAPQSIATRSGSSRWLIGMVASLIVAVGAGAYLWTNRPFFAFHAPSKGLPPPPVAPAADGWRDLMVESPVIFTHSLGGIPEKPGFDAIQKTFTVQADQTRWIATAGNLNGGEFELQAEFSVNGWIGGAGFIWQLAVDPRVAPVKEYRCFAVEYLRMSADEAAELRWKEFVVNEIAFDQRIVNHISSFAAKEIEPPLQEWVKLKCRVAPAQISVWFGDEIVWEASDVEVRARGVPVLNAPCGITGYGPEVRVRGLSAQLVR